MDATLDHLRYARYGPGYTPVWRRATDAAIIGLSGSTDQSGTAKGIAVNNIGDALELGDIENAKGLLKEAVLNSEKNADVRKGMPGMERTVEFIGEIWQKMQDFEDAGGDLNLISGTDADIKQKVGLADKEGEYKGQLNEIASEIMLAVQGYRVDVSGKTFTEMETAEYKKVFPSTFATIDLNKAKVNALLGKFKGDVDFYYTRKLGGESIFNKLFGESMFEDFTIAPQGFPGQEEADDNPMSLRF